MKKKFIKTALVVASTALSAIAGLQVAHADSYVVQQGDSFFGIASAHGMSPYDLAAKNGKSIFDTINPAKTEGGYVMRQTDTGALIAQLRKEQGLTQKQLAEQLHISDRTISKWERGGSLR